MKTRWTRSVARMREIITLDVETYIWGMGLGVRIILYGLFSDIFSYRRPHGIE